MDAFCLAHLLSKSDVFLASVKGLRVRARTAIQSRFAENTSFGLVAVCGVAPTFAPV